MTNKKIIRTVRSFYAAELRLVGLYFKKDLLVIKGRRPLIHHMSSITMTTKMPML